MRSTVCTNNAQSHNGAWKGITYCDIQERSERLELVEFTSLGGNKERQNAEHWKGNSWAIKCLINM